MNCTNVSSLTNQTIECSAESNSATISVLVCLVLVFGFLLNIFSMWVFKYRTPEWKSGTVLQFHLVISDLIICPLAPFLTVYFAVGHWPFGHLMCHLKIVLMITHFYGSIFFLTLISIHRYVSVVYHSQEFRMKQKDFVKKLCIGVWVIVLIIGVVFSAVLDTSPEGNRTLCLSIHQGNNTEVYFISSFIQLLAGFLVPFTISLVCYSRLARSVSGLNICHPKGKLIKSKSLKMMAVCLLIFGLCFTPMNVIYTVLVVVKKFYAQNCDLLLQMETSYYVSWVLCSANCCLDPLIYCFASRNFTGAFRSSLRKIGVRIQTPREDTEHDSALTTHIMPTPRTSKKKNISITHL